MKHLLLLVLLLSLCSPARADYLGSWKIDDALTFSAQTSSSTGAATDADSAPTYRVYEDETGTAIITGTMATLDSSNTDGFYSEQITLSAANGLEKGKSYTIRIAATVGGVTGATTHNFQIEAEVDANTVSPTVSADAVSISGDTTAADNAELAFDGTGYQDADNINGPRTWYVNTTSGDNGNTGLIRSLPLQTFAQAQTNASSGDTIEFTNASSTTAINISKAVTVRGPRTTRYHTITVASGDAITIACHNVTLENMAGISTESAASANGVYAQSRHDITLIRCKYESEDAGILLYQCSNVTLDKVIARSVGTSGAANDRATDGVFLEGGANWRLTDCQFRIHSDGAAERNAAIFYGAMHGTVENCRFEVIKTSASAVEASCLLLAADDALLSPIYEAGISETQVEPPFLALRNNLFYAETQTGDTALVRGLVDERDPAFCPDGVSVFLDGGNKWWFNLAAGNTSKKIVTKTDSTIIVRGGDVLLADCDTSAGGRIQIDPPNFAALGINASGHVSRVTLADTVTALTEEIGIGSAAQVHNQEPVPARTAKLGSRADAVVKAFPTLRIAPGEVTQLWIDCSRQVTSNLQNVSNAASSSVEITVSSVGMFGRYASVVVDATEAEAADTATITCDVTPFSGQTLKVSLDVVVDGD